MKADLVMQKLEAELLAIQKEREALGLPGDMRQFDLTGVSKDRLESLMDILKREISCMQRMSAHINATLRGNQGNN